MSDGAQQTWSPILKGEQASRAAAAVNAVAEAIGERPLPARNRGAGLAAGEAGIALFYEYLDRVHPGAGCGEIAQRRLERAIEILASSPQAPSLYGGFTGVSWVVEHLQGGTVEEEDEDANSEIDAALLDHLRQGPTPWPHEYDLIGGLVGYGIYALERLPRPSAAACLERVVERLAEIARLRPEGIAWHRPYEMLPEPNKPWFPQGTDNLGVAHGTPGVIALLARVCTSGVAAQRAHSLLTRSVPWLLAQKLPENETSVFPYSVGPGVKIRPARTAWCYGDPGIALALFLAGRSAGEPAWEREALDLARRAARRPFEDCHVEDAGLCHGAAGLGHLFNRLYQATGEAEFLEGARSWLGRALDDYWEPGRGIGGFLAYAPPEGDFDQLIWKEEAGFLAGSAGVALALLAAISGVDPAWDRALLVSPLPEKSTLP